MTADLNHPLISRGFDALPRGGFAYLATPYTNVDAAWAVEKAVWWQAHLAQVYRVSSVSPVVMGHHMEPHMTGYTWREWMDWGAPMLTAARCVAVPPIEGWKNSAGIAEEIETALRNNMPVILG